MFNVCQFNLQGKNQNGKCTRGVCIQCTEIHFTATIFQEDKVFVAISYTTLMNVKSLIKLWCMEAARLACWTIFTLTHLAVQSHLQSFDCSQGKSGILFLCFAPMNQELFWFRDYSSPSIWESAMFLMVPLDNNMVPRDKELSSGGSCVFGFQSVDFTFSNFHYLYGTWSVVWIKARHCLKEAYSSYSR